MLQRRKQFHFSLTNFTLALLILGALLAGVGYAAVAPAQAQETAGAWVNTDALNVRSGPGVGYQVVDIVTRGEEVTVTHRAAGSNWVRVITPAGVAGWVNSFYLASNLKPFTFLPVWQSEPTPSPETVTASVNTFALNVRSGPGVGYQRVDIVTRGEEVTVTHRAPNSAWVRVMTPDGVTGWVNSFYLASNLKPFTFLPVWQGEPAPAPETAAAAVNAFALNVRSGPGVGYQVVDIVTRGEEVTVTHRAAGSNWVRVITPAGLAGWVNSFYLASNLKPFTFLPVWQGTVGSARQGQAGTEVLLYWLDEMEVQGVAHTLAATDDASEAALEALLAGPPAGYETAIPTPEEVAAYPGRQPDWGERVHLLDLTVENGVATADFSQEMQAYGGGSARVLAIREQITQTLLQFPQIDEVLIAVAGEVETALQP